MIQSAKRKLIIPFLLPGMLLIFVFFILPAIQTIQVSFLDWYSTFKTTNFLGLENYKNLFQDSQFIVAIKNTFKYFFISLVILFPLSVFFALSLNTIKKGRLTIQFLIFSPVVLSVVVASVMWKFIYNPNFGLINWFLESIGLESLTRAWLGDESTALIAVILVTIWHGIATWIILIIAGLDRIPKELSEAARIEGANEIQIFFRIKLPLLWEVLSTLIILWFIQAMQTFPFIFVMTQGGPHGSTEVMGTYLYKMAFEGRMFSYGSAMAVIMTLIILVFSYIGNKLIKREPIEF